MKTKKELKIFKTVNLEALKSIYFKSKAYVIDKICCEAETTHLTDALGQFTDSEKTESFTRFEDE